MLFLCLDNYTELQWFMKKGMITRKRICPERCCDVQLEGTDTDDYQWICLKHGRVDAHEISYDVMSNSRFEWNHMS